MRKPAEIEREKSGVLWKYVIEECQRADIRSAIKSRLGVVLLLGDARTVASRVVKASEEAGEELGLAPQEEEARALAYLRTVGATE
jgi:hypothetical protein